MTYYTDLFSPETHKAFSESDQTVSGFRIRQRNLASDVNIGDRLICYVTKISRWVGILEVVSKYFEDNTPIFYEQDDPFVVRFKVKPIVWLKLENALPIHDDSIWNKLSFTKGNLKNTSNWTGALRNSLRELNPSDGKYLETQLIKQSKELKKFPLEESELRKLQINKVRTLDSKQVVVSIPDEGEDEVSTKDKKSLRESLQIQALLAKIGERMGFKIWIPRSDRSRVFELCSLEKNSILESLPLNYDNTTLKTIENIDILWIKSRSIVRAFEVEHKTSIYSGILRMADLMALQPNLQIRAHIVAPLERKDKVFQEITRPVFALLEKGPLYESCSFISYDSIHELSNEKRLEYMKDDVLEVYAELAIE